jgi:hypothetical protein
MIWLTIIFLLCFVPSANAEQRYIWNDENGQTHVSETEPENWETQKYEQTEESKQAEIQRDREKAMREAQLKTAEERKRSIQSQGSKGTDNVTGRLPTKRKKG